MTTEVLKDGEGVRVGRDGRVTRIVKDKGSVYVPLVLMDGAPSITTVDAALHRPGFRGSTDAKSAEAHASYVADLGNAWRTPSTEAPAAKPAPTADAREAAYQSMVGDLESAWRT